MARSRKPVVGRRKGGRGREKMKRNTKFLRQA